jgi:hypothetical protein
MHSLKQLKEMTGRIQTSRFLLLTQVLLFFCTEVFPGNIPVLHFFAEAGQYRRINTPVCIGTERILKSDTLSFRLFEKINGKLVEKVVQEEEGYNTSLWFILDGNTEPGIKREFYLFSGQHSDSTDGIITDVTQEAIILKKGKTEILSYRTAVMYPPEGVDSVYKRSGFIHPVISPSGNVLTRINPPDHFHHFGIWNPWTRVRIGDHVTDFWNLNEKQGTVDFAGINSVCNGPVFGGFSVKQDHMDFQQKNNDKPVINEEWDVRAWNIEPVPGLKCYIVDLTSSMSPGTGFPITLEAYRYGGGTGIRANEEWTNNNSTILTSEGKTRIDADGSRARWTDLNGEFAGKGTSGIVFFSHPANREHPEPMRVWPPDANNGRGDVYFEFCPIRHKAWILNPGNVYRLKYRILVYDGKITSDEADRLWNDFAHPPEVTIVK